ncbi:hypothetical protein ACQP2T_22915 [Nonomuraea sp. CA-143628]|uniref:hypothetical protein n=1 Tax=Nonomuraea sp. CA-143628 TaxID=3239997 RepID=UPI003D8A06A5
MKIGLVGDHRSPGSRRCARSRRRSSRTVSGSSANVRRLAALFGSHNTSPSSVCTN